MNCTVYRVVVYSILRNYFFTFYFEGNILAPKTARELRLDCITIMAYFNC